MGEVKKMKDSGKWRVKKCAEKSRKKDALGLREEGNEGEENGWGGEKREKTEMEVKMEQEGGWVAGGVMMN